MMNLTPHCVHFGGTLGQHHLCTTESSCLDSSSTLAFMRVVCYLCSIVTNSTCWNLVLLPMWLVVMFEWWLMAHNALLRDNDNDKHRTSQAATSPCVFERRNIQAENTHENKRKPLETTGIPSQSYFAFMFIPPTHTQTYTQLYTEAKNIPLKWNQRYKLNIKNTP